MTGGLLLNLGGRVPVCRTRVTMDSMFKVRAASRLNRRCVMFDWYLGNELALNIVLAMSVAVLN